MICDVCQTIFIPKATHSSSKSDIKPRPHHLTCQSLKRSVELGCYICNGIWTTLNSSEKDIISSVADSGPRSARNGRGDCVDGSPEEKSFITESSLEDGSTYGRPGCHLAQFGIDGGALFTPEMIQHSAYWRATFVLQPRTDAELPYIRDGLAQSTKSAETLSLAKKWIAACTAEHQECNRRPAETGSYPTRLLDCGTSDDPGTCRLVETSITAINEPYMTLSHCWGQADCLKLTTENRAQFLDRIPLSLLPQLYQDAIHVTRSLGVRYLWVDALCIIQRGDKSYDWQHEVTIMDKVYSNSFCNISPTVAPDSNYSIFAVRDPDLLYPQTVNVTISGKITPCTVLHSDIWKTEVTSAQLNKRAWVLQERLLSPRVLHFGASQVLWECRKKCACEVYPDGLSTGLSRPNGLFKNLASTHHATSDKTGDVAISAYRPWTQIVRAYSACDLTFPGDKLVAISGVAKIMARVLRDDYVAGMWRRYLERELLWSVIWSQRKNVSEPAAYRAPSWSWASADVEVNPGQLDVNAADVLIEVQDVELEYSTDDITGLLHGGWLRLRGVLKHLDLQPHQPTTIGGYRDWSMVVNGVHISVLSNSEMQEPQPHIIPDAPPEDFDKEIADGDVYGMPARMRQGDGGTIYVLILRLVDRERGVFRRIGIAHGWGKDVKEKILAHTAEEKNFPCEAYSDGYHYVRII